MKQRDKTKRDKAAVLAIVHAAPGRVFARGKSALFAEAGVPEERARHALHLLIRCGDVREDEPSGNIIELDRAKAVAGFNGFTPRRGTKAKRSPEEVREQLRAARARARDVLSSISIVPKQVMPDLSDEESDAFARRHGMRPIKPPPGKLPERRSTAAQRDAAEWNASQIAPAVGIGALDFMAKHGR